MKRLRKGLYFILAITICFTFLVGCGNSKLSDAFKEEEVKESVENIISYINKKDSESLLGVSTVALKNALTDEVLEGVYEAIGEGGEFKEILDMSVGGQKDKNSEEEFALAVAKVKYENKNFIYTLTFTKQMKLAGLFYK